MLALVALLLAPAAAGDQVVADVGDGHQVVLTVDAEGRVLEAHHRAPAPVPVGPEGTARLLQAYEARVAACQEACGEDEACRERCDAPVDPHAGRQARSHDELLPDPETCARLAARFTCPTE